MKFFVTTFGCRTNQADSAAIRERFLAATFTETDSCTDADVVILNSCTVTQRTDQQVRQLTRKVQREKAAVGLKRKLANGIFFLFQTMTRFPNLRSGLARALLMAWCNSVVSFWGLSPGPETDFCIHLA